jgi:hypothetical protein
MTTRGRWEDFIPEQGLYPVGGVAWDYLQDLNGLVRLGHDVYYHEDTWSWPYQPVEV